MKDEVTEINPKRAISPVSVSNNTALVGQIIDKQGFESLTYLVNIGVAGTSDATFTVSMEHGNVSDLSDSAAVPADDLIGTYALASFTGADANKTRKIGYKGAKRYTRLTITPAGNSAAAIIGAIGLLGDAAIQPTANPPV
jgi:hypothetical protein